MKVSCSQVQEIAHQVVVLQQRSTVVTITNLLALVLMQCLVRNQALLLEAVVEEVNWVIGVLRRLGASVFESDAAASLRRISVVHSRMVRLDREGRLRLLSGLPMSISDGIQTKMKGACTCNKKYEHDPMTQFLCLRPSVRACVRTTFKELSPFFFVWKLV